MVERRYTRVAEMQYTRVYNIQTTWAKRRCRADGGAEHEEAERTTKQSGQQMQRRARGGRADGRCRAEHEEAERTPKRRCRPAPRQGRPAGGHEQSSSWEI